MNYTIIFSDRKTLAICIEKGEVIVRAPKKCPTEYIAKIIESKKGWISKHLKRFENTEKPKDYTPEEILQMKEKLQKYLIPRIAFFAEKHSFLPKITNIKITKSEKRWGSCSSKNNLCFSYRLAEYLDNNTDFIDAVIVHELAHLKEKNHQKPFWNLVTFMMPNYHQIIQQKHQKTLP